MCEIIQDQFDEMVYKCQDPNFYDAVFNIRDESQNLNKNSKNSKDYKLIPNKVAIIGLMPFAYIALYFRSFTALTILINGIIFHSRFLDYDIMRIIDILVNTIMLIYYIIIS